MNILTIVTQRVQICWTVSMLCFSDEESRDPLENDNLIIKLDYWIQIVHTKEDNC